MSCDADTRKMPSIEAALWRRRKSRRTERVLAERATGRSLCKTERGLAVGVFLGLLFFRRDLIFFFFLSESCATVADTSFADEFEKLFDFGILFFVGSQMKVATTGKIKVKTKKRQVMGWIVLRRRGV